MPKPGPRKPQKSSKIGDDGLSDRERLFAQERRKDPTAPGHEIAERAGFVGTPAKLGERARVVMKKAGVLAIIHAPDPVDGDDGEINDEKLKKELRRTLLVLARGAGSAADKLKAIDKLGATLAGFYVPVQIDLKNKMTMEHVVRAMGGAPDEPGQPQALPDKGADA